MDVSFEMLWVVTLVKTVGAHNRGTKGISYF